MWYVQACIHGKDRHNEMQIECRRSPPTLFNSGSLAKFPKILPTGHAESMHLGMWITGT